MTIRAILSVQSMAALILFAHCEVASAQQNALPQLLSAEREFATASATTSTKAAFLAYLSDDAVIFRRGVVNGKKFWNEVPDAQDKLTWEPQYGDVSTGGDFGFTTGPFKQYQNRTDANPVAEGHYVSVWKKQHGVWKVVLDGGVGHPPADLSTWQSKPENASVAIGKSPQQVVSEIHQLESSLRKTFEEKGNRAFATFVSTDVRLYRPRQAPYRKNDLPQLEAETDKKFSYGPPMQTEVAQAGDLAYTIGPVGIQITTGANTRQLNANYVRIWKHEQTNGWKLIVDMILL